MKNFNLKEEQMKQRVRFLFLVLLAFGVVACANMGTTNTSVTNVGVTSYEATGVLLTQAFTTEKALLRAGKITAAQDVTFQRGVYGKATKVYKAVGTAAVMVLTVTDSDSKKTAQEKFNVLNAQLPVLVADVMKFIEGVK